MGQFKNFEKYEDQTAKFGKIIRRILKFIACR